MGNRLITENQLDEWVRAHSSEAQGVIVELVSRLVVASCPRAVDRRFPLSIGQHGPDGVLDTRLGFPPFVSEGRSFWEIGTNIDAGKKATEDYRSLVKATPKEVRLNSSFVFVTPLSGRRGWEFTWKPAAQARWLETRRSRGDWDSVHVLDGSQLIDWLQQFPAVEVWLARAMDLPAHEMQTPEQRWDELRTIGEPPPLIPEVFLSNRGDACAKLAEIVEGKALQLKIDTHYPRQVVDFVCAYLASIEGELRAEAEARCLIVVGANAWNAICALPEQHILVADFDLDENDTIGARLFEQARRRGHVVVFGGQPGGIPHPNRVSLPNPKIHQISEALKNAGYPPERARTLAQKSGGNLGSLLRCLQNLSLMPEWAQRTDAAELAIAQLLGGWQESSQADRLVAEQVSGKAYGEWIETMHDLSLRPGTPLTNQEGLWKLSARYETWYALGPRVFDEHLDRLQKAAILVLSERDPKFDLPPEERYLANVRGKVLTHSHSMRRGLAESLALVGNHARALTSCSLGKAEAVAVVTVRELLVGADWERWASLNRLLPLLAEAAPGEFLDNVESALGMQPSPLVALFAQESSPIMGSNYMSGLLWALETLAWEAEHLPRVVLLLGELAAIDPGGQWGNRPSNSLTTILLPWLPQTCAPIEKRLAAVAALMNEFPEVGWKLLLSLLPRSHQTSTETSKPTWRESIPDDWAGRVSRGEYATQVTAYTESAIAAARTNPTRLAQLLDHLDDLSQPAQDTILTYLATDAVSSLPTTDQYELWTKLTALVIKHRKYVDADWALPSERVDQIAKVAERLEPSAPALRHRRLFSNRIDLYEEKGNYQGQEEALNERRRVAISEILQGGGAQAVLAFSESVESPWRVGFALGTLGNGVIDQALLPNLLLTENIALARMAGSFVSGRYATQGWPWVDQLPVRKWTQEEIGQFFAYLPFIEAIWERVVQFLPDNEAPYWTKTGENPYPAKDENLEYAIERLLRYGRPRTAVRCLNAMLYAKRRINSQQGVSALLASVGSTELGIDAYEMLEVIKALQEDPNTDQKGLFWVEWKYLPLLEDRHEATPTTLERRLAEDPEFFCEIIRLIFRSRKEEAPQTEPSQEQQQVAQNAYRLLHTWKIPPGTLRDGTYDGAALTVWLDYVKTSCTESGHLEIAMLMAGHVFVSAPADPDGLWIHHAAAAALNAKEARIMREGFTTELFNSRGVHGFSSGKEEEEIAKGYHGQADAVDVRGYPRLAAALRELAATYERYAERERLRDPYSD